MPSESTPPESPPAIPGYALAAQIAGGGMGSVHRARQLSIDRPVAVKILARKYTDDAVFVERFLKEARAAARMSHPNIVQAIDVGMADGAYYFVMELVEGSSLSALLREKGKLPPLEACSIITQIARALEHAAHHGMLHLDIKPANIMITPTGMAKLADFGLARHVEDEDTLYTQKRVIFGTPPYMSPEQLNGEMDLDSRSDIYSLGVVFYELVTGQNPFKAPTTKDILRKVRSGNPPPAHAADAGVPQDVGQVIEKMMAYRPEDRYATPSELLIDLDALARLHTPPVVNHLLRPAAAAADAAPARSRTTLVVLLTLLTLSTALLSAVWWILGPPWRTPGDTPAASAPPQPLAPPTPSEPAPPSDPSQPSAPPSDASDPSNIALEKAFREVFFQATQHLAEERHRDALDLYEDFAARNPNTHWGEEASREARSLRRNARWRAEDLAAAANAAIEKKEFETGETLCRRMEKMNLPETSDLARSTRERLQRAVEHERSLQEEQRRRAAATALTQLDEMLRQMIPAGSLDSAAKACRTILADALLGGIHPAVQERLDRIQQMLALRDAVFAGAQDAKGYILQGSPDGARVTGLRNEEILAEKNGQSLILPWPQLSGADLHALAALGGAPPLVARGALAVFLEAARRHKEAYVEIRHLRQAGDVPLPAWFLAMEPRVILETIHLLVEEKRPLPAYELFQYLKRTQSGSEFYAANRQRLRRVVERIRARCMAGMRPVPAGAFTYGKTSAPQTRSLPLFYMDTHEVTNAEYAEFLEAVAESGSKAFDHPRQPPSKSDHVPLDWAQRSQGRPKYPVVGVDWFDAYAYARWRGKRLPTEEEWEKAARGVDARKYPWGPVWKDGVCNAPPSAFMSERDRPRDVMPVGSFPQGNSPYDIADMAGNVREWIDTTPEESGEIAPVRGGSFEDLAGALAANARILVPCLLRDHATGFRCVMDALDFEL